MLEADAPAAARDPRGSARPVDLVRAERAFLAAHPDYRATVAVDALRAAEYARLETGGGVYLDHAGAGLYSVTQVLEHQRLLLDHVFGNPHSSNPTASFSTALADRARTAVLRHFGADAETYACIFTANATAALRLVGEAYPFGPGARLLLTADNHNSVNGIREFARAKGATTGSVPLERPELRVDDGRLERLLARGPGDGPSVFAYPAQSNFSGVRHPLEWIATAQREGWHVILDAAAFVPTGRLDLAVHRPDFVAVSFYKLFGYPTGIGALLARRDALRVLRRPWFSGGTVLAATVTGERVVPVGGHAGYEDGTVDFLGLPAVAIGLRHVEAVGIDTISRRVRALGSWLLARLGELRHTGGAPVVRVYGPGTFEARGATIAMNFLHRDGSVVDERHVDRAAGAEGISLRTGCFCNPGAGEAAFGLAPGPLAREAPASARDLDGYLRRIGMPSGGAVRVSLGLASTFADVHRFLAFAEGFRDLERSPRGLPARTGC